MEKENDILVQTLIRGRDSAKKLQNMLCGETNDDHVSVSVDDLLTEVSKSFAHGLSMLSTSRSEVHQESEVFRGNTEKTLTVGQSFSADSNLSRNNEKTPLVPVKQGRGQYKRKTGDTRSEVISDTSGDSFQWRKYGQKAILNSKFPRCYYRCTYLHDQGCKANKHVQQLEDESNKFRVTYFGRHTCKMSPSNDHYVPHHEPGFLDFGGFKNQQSLKINSSTTKKIGFKPSRKKKYHANAIPGSDQGGSSHSVMSDGLDLGDTDFFENLGEDFFSSLFDDDECN